MVEEKKEGRKGRGGRREGERGGKDRRENLLKLGLRSNPSTSSP